MHGCRLQSHIAFVASEKVIRQTRLRIASAESRARRLKCWWIVDPVADSKRAVPPPFGLRIFSVRSLSPYI